MDAWVGGILARLAVGVAASLTLLPLQYARPRVSALAPIAGPDAFVPITTAGAEPVPGLVIVRPEAPVLSLNATSVLDTIRAQVAAMPAPPQVVVLDLEESSSIDITVLDAFRSLATDFTATNIAFWVSNVHPDVERVMRLDDGAESGPAVLTTNAEAVARCAARPGTLG